MRVSKYLIRRSKDEKPELQLIPFIDILFVLIIFFMVTTTFSNVSNGLNVKLPSSNVKEVSPDTEVIVSITKEGFIYVNNAKVDLEEFEAEVSKKLKEFEKTNVVIRADEELEYKTVVKVISMSKNAGALEVDIATEEDKTGE